MTLDTRVGYRTRMHLIRLSFSHVTTYAVINGALSNVNPNQIRKLMYSDNVFGYQTKHTNPTKLYASVENVNLNVQCHRSLSIPSPQHRNRYRNTVIQFLTRAVVGYIAHTLVRCFFHVSAEAYIQQQVYTYVHIADQSDRQKQHDGKSMTALWQVRNSAMVSQKQCDCESQHIAANLKQDGDKCEQNYNGTMNMM